GLGPRLSDISGWASSMTESLGGFQPKRSFGVQRSSKQSFSRCSILTYATLKFNKITRRRPPDAVLHQKRQVLLYPTQPKNTPRIEFQHNILRVLASEA